MLYTYNPIPACSGEERGREENHLYERRDNESSAWLEERRRLCGVHATPERDDAD
jgi:hypothetical protein